jgi:hypothetical protein
MTYFHTREGTIIGAEAFHGPVREGKGWFHFAMVARHNLLPDCRDADSQTNTVLQIRYYEIDVTKPMQRTTLCR